MPSPESFPDRLPSGNHRRRIYTGEVGPDATTLPVERTHRKIYVEAGESSDRRGEPEAPGVKLAPDMDSSRPAEIERNPDDMKAFEEWLKVAPAWLIESADNNVGTLHDWFTGRTKPSDYRKGTPTFTHAGTGEKMSLQDVVSQIEQPLSPGLQEAMDATVEELTGAPESPEATPSEEELKRAADTLVASAEQFLKDRSGKTKTIETSEGPMHVNTALLEETPEHTVSLGETTDEKGEVTHVEVTVEDTTSGEKHSVDVAHPVTNPDVTIDGQPVQSGELPIVQEVIKEVKDIVDAKEAATVEADTHQEDPTAEETIEKTAEEVAEQVDKLAEDNPPAAEHPANPENAQDNPLKVVAKAIQSYLNNPVTADYLRAMKFDPSALSERFRSGQVDPYGEAVQELRKLWSEAPSDSAIWDTKHGNSSEMQKVASTLRARLESILNRLANPPESQDTPVGDRKDY